VALVTGGRAASAAPSPWRSRRRAHVVAAARGTNAEGTVEAITAAGPAAVSADVTDAASVEAMPTAALQHNGRLTSW
jgi:hypothetical protein